MDPSPHVNFVSHACYTCSPEVLSYLPCTRCTGIWLAIHREVRGGISFAVSSWHLKLQVLEHFRLEVFNLHEAPLCWGTRGQEEPERLQGCSGILMARGPKAKTDKFPHYP